MRPAKRRGAPKRSRASGGPPASATRNAVDSPSPFAGMNPGRYGMMAQTSWKSVDDMINLLPGSP